MKSIESFCTFFLTISVHTKYSGSSNNNIKNNEISLSGYQSIVNIEQIQSMTTSKSTSIIISGEFLKEKGTSRDESFQIDFIDSEIPIPIQMNNSFLVFISCALLVLAFVNVITF
ncbi:hypothetical protein ACTA71_008316 [Dictyostelium dimigraforme]